MSISRGIFWGLGACEGVRMWRSLQASPGSGEGQKLPLLTHRPAESRE